MPDNEKRLGSLKPLILLALLLVVGLFASWCVIVLIWGGDFAVPGAFGDSFGVVNALFSGLALAAVAVTLWQAQRQIGIQQEELQQNTKELAGQRQQMELHNQYLVKQSVQNQFFQMLDSWQELIGQLAFDKLKGRHALLRISNELARDVAVQVQSANRKPLDVRHELICSAFSSLRVQGVQLGNYFRLFYHIMRFIDRSQPLSADERHDLARIVRAHLSDAEFMLLFYNSARPDNRKLHSLVEKYDLLQNMNEQSVAHAIDLDFYPVTKQRWNDVGKIVTDRN